MTSDDELFERLRKLRELQKKYDEDKSGVYFEPHEFVKFWDAFERLSHERKVARDAAAEESDKLQCARDYISELVEERNFARAALVAAEPVIRERDAAIAHADKLAEALRSAGVPHYEAKTLYDYVTWRASIHHGV